MHPVKLIMVTDQNNNKFYNMTPNADGATFTAEYGRVDATSQTVVKPMSKWGAVYRDKVRKGYRDVTQLYVVHEDTRAVQATPFDGLINRLRRFAKTVVDDNYVVGNAATQALIDEAQAGIDRLAALAQGRRDVRAFNDALVKLFAVLPRRMRRVGDHLAVSAGDMARVVAREQDLLDALAVTVASRPVTQAPRTVLEELGLRMSAADAELERLVKDMLGDISDRYVNCWRVVNERTQARYDAHLAGQTGIHRTEQLFWHGSRNENWLSILRNGMLVRPAGAVVTGGMFGSTGLYFANRARKSFGYTSGHGSYWARGNSNTAFMAIFKVNTGKHHNIYKHTAACCDLTRDKLKAKGNFDSVYAHKGADLVNDEFIVYDVAQVTIHALVELRG